MTFCEYLVKNYEPSIRTLRLSISLDEAKSVLIGHKSGKGWLLEKFNEYIDRHPEEAS